MSKPGKKDPVVTTGKVKDLTVSPAVKKAFAGKADDKVTTITVDNEHLAGTRPEHVKPSKGSKASAVSEEIFRQAGDLPTSIVTPGSALDIMIKEHTGSTPFSAQNANEDLPSVNQIEDAERVLKAAGRVSEGRRGYVTANGEDLVPIKTDIRTKHNRIEVDLDGSNFLIHLGDMSAFDLSARVFNLFVGMSNGMKTVYLVDQDSHVEIPKDEGRNNYWIGHHGMAGNKQGILVLISSSSKRDTVVGESILVNTDSSDNLLNSSYLIATREQPRPHEVHFLRHDDHRQSEHDPWNSHKKIEFPLVKNRAIHVNSRFKRATITDSFVSPGQYHSVHIRNSVIEGASSCAVSNSSVIKTTLFGTVVALKQSNLSECGIRSEGELYIKYTPFNHLHLSTKKALILNKFNYLSLDTSRGKLLLVRTGRHEFDLGSSVYDFQRLKLNASEEEVCKVISGIMSFDEEGMPVALTSITSSFVNYLTESVMSRLKVIRLLDEAKALVNETGMRSHGYEDFYSL